MWFRRTKKTVLGIVAAFSLLLSVATPLVMPHIAMAAGSEKYQFQDASTIIGSGGDFPQNITFKINGGAYIGTFSVGAGKGGAVTRSWTITGVTKSAANSYSGTISTSGAATQGKNITGAITVADPNNVGPGSTAAAGSANNNILDDEEKPVCESSTSALSWFICPIVNGLGDFTDWITTNLVVPFMRPSPVGLDPNDKATGAVYQIWSDMRVYADIILVILLLIAVISQAYGGGIVEAYTAKKMLPRILVAAILINTSIYVVAFAIDMSNVIGAGIADIITTPLVQTGNFKFSPDNTQAFAISGIIVGLGAITAFFVSSGLLLAVMPFILLFLVLPAFLAIVAIFVILAFLQGLYMALTIFSPIAFALYAFPNTEKYFHRWWDWLLRALLVYPFYMAILGVTDVFTVLIQKANGN